jgi:carbon monoxide dehydrogenase subunit G
MKPITCSVSINATPQAVFAACTDFANAPERVKGIVRVEMLTDGPVGLGTKFKETRIMFKREATETMEVTAYEPPHRVQLSANSCGAEFHSEFKITPEGNGSRVDVTMTTKPISFFAKLMSPLGFLMAGTMKKCLQDDLEDIKAYVEKQN